MPVLRAALRIVALLGLTLSASERLAVAQPTTGGKFAPPPGQTLIAVGAAWGDELSSYSKTTGHHPRGVKFYDALKTAKNADFFRHNARNNIPPGGFLVLEADLDGLTDEGIRSMGEAIKEFGGPVFADLEGEFETDFRDRPRDYVAAYRRVHDAWDRLGVTNVAYIGHTFGDLTQDRRPRPNLTMAELLEYYPGDRYVDWFGVSLFARYMVGAVDRFVQMAHQRGKPVALVEFGHRSPNAWNWDGTWDGWYAPAFDLIRSWDIKLVGYSNYGDGYSNSPRATPGDPFLDTRMDRMPLDVRDGWAKLMRTPRFRDSGPAPTGKGPLATHAVLATPSSRPSPPSPASPRHDAAIHVRRVSVSLSVKGDCSLSVDTRSEVPATEPPQGKPATIVGLSNAMVMLADDGTHEALYSFGEVGTTADFAALNGSPMPIDGISINKTAGALLMTPILVGKGPVKKASFSFPRYLKAPISTTIDFEDFDEYTVFLTFKFAEGLFQVRVSPQHPGWEQDGSRLGATFTPLVNNRTGKESVMLEGKLKPDRLAEYAFHIPADPSLLGRRAELNVHLQGHEPASIARLDVRGRIIPSFGLSLDSDKGGVKLKAPIRDGAAERAGVQAGDVLVSIAGEKVSDVKGTVNRLSDLTAGTDIPFVVRRAGQEKTVVVRGD